MSLAKHIAGIRKKPRRVRERILVVSMIVIAAGLIVVLYFTYKTEPINMTGGFTSDIVGGITSSFSNPVYKDAFSTPSLDTLTGNTPANPAPASK